MISGAHVVVHPTDASADEGGGPVTALRLPGGGELGLYEPRHPGPLD